MKRILGFIIGLLAIVGGINALIQAANSNAGEEVMVTNDFGAGQFASSFITSYLSFDKDQGFTPINAYTSLKDTRKQNERVRKNIVVSAVPTNITTIIDHYLRVELFVQVLTQFADENEREKANHTYYTVQVPIVQNSDGSFHVAHYPSIESYHKTLDESPPYPEKAGEETINRIRPMVDSFFRTFFMAKERDELSPFFVSGASIPHPQNQDFDYLSLDEISAYGSANSLIVYATCIVFDNSLLVSYPMTYELSILNQNNRLVVETLN